MPARAVYCILKIPQEEINIVVTHGYKSRYPSRSGNKARSMEPQKQRGKGWNGSVGGGFGNIMSALENENI